MTKKITFGVQAAVDRRDAIPFPEREKKMGQKIHREDEPDGQPPRSRGCRGAKNRSRAARP